MSFPEYVQHYRIHMNTGDVFDWYEDYEAEPGIVTLWGDFLEGKNTAKAFVCETEMGPVAYIPYKNICYITVGEARHVGPMEGE